MFFRQIIGTFDCSSLSIDSRYSQSQSLNSLNITVRLDIKAVLLGILDTENISIIVNYTLLESKYFIYRSRLNKDSLCIKLLVVSNRTFNRKKKTKSISTIKNGNLYSH